MNRRKGLQSKTPLKPGKPLARKTEMPHGKGFKAKAGALVAKAKKKAKPGSNAGLDELKKQARQRDGDTCVKCGVVVTGRPSNVHHRRNRGSGGSRKANVISNLITLCGTPTSGCHGELTLRPWECDAERFGWVLSTNGTSDPATEVVLVAWLGPCLPTADGRWERIEEYPVGWPDMTEGSPSDLDGIEQDGLGSEWPRDAMWAGDL